MEKYKTWLPNTKYEGRLMLIGGYDSAGQMSFSRMAASISLSLCWWKVDPHL